MNTKAIMNICEELKEVKIKVQVGKKRRKQQKKKKLMSSYREERMQEDTVKNGPFSYTVFETCNEDAREVSELFFHLFFSKFTPKDKDAHGGLSVSSAFHAPNTV